MNNRSVDKKLKKEYGSLISIIMNIALVIAALIFIISLFSMIGEIRRVYKSDRGNMSSMIYYLEDDEFGNMASAYYTRSAAVAPVDKDVKYCYDIAEYAHEAFMERVYDCKGDASRKERCSIRMQELRNGLGEYEIAADKADEQLKKFSR